MECRQSWNWWSCPPDIPRLVGVSTSWDFPLTHVNHSMVPISQHWLPTVEAAGIAVNPDAYGGKTAGGFFSLSAINPSNWTRSYAKSAYIDPLPPRSNLHILLNTTVTRIIFDSSSSGGLKATAVEFSTGRGATTHSVQVRKEVIVSGGSVNSPQILQLSGVGPADVLKEAGVEVKLDLPGVGTHLQDHIVGDLNFLDVSFADFRCRALVFIMRVRKIRREISTTWDLLSLCVYITLHVCH